MLTDEQGAQAIIDLQSIAGEEIHNLAARARWQGLSPREKMQTERAHIKAGGVTVEGKSKHGQRAFKAGINKRWDDFRGFYGDLTIEDLIWMNTKWDDTFPSQNKATSQKFVEMFWMLRGELRFAELGCYEGLLYRTMVKQFPHKIKEWTGYDVNHAAVERANYKDPYSSFTGIKLGKWFWEVDLTGFDVFVCSHTLEHFNYIQVHRILVAIEDLEYILLEVPFSGNEWRGYGGSHVLKVKANALEHRLSLTHEKFYDGSGRFWITGWRKR